MLIGQSHDDIEQEKQIITAMKNHRVDGLIVSISKHTKNYVTKQAIEFLIANGHKSIGVINRPEEMRSCKERANTYVDVLKKEKM